MWSWHSEGDTSPDEMPDYDKMKYKKQSRRHPPKDTEREECKYLGYDLKKHAEYGYQDIFILIKLIHSAVFN